MLTVPIKGYKHAAYPQGNVTQWFGENVPLYLKAMGWTGGHNGIDIVAPWGTPIYAVEGGLVVEVKDTPEGYGKHLRIVSEPNAEGVGREWTYGHNSKNYVKIGDAVVAGAHIADMGNTGFVVSGATPYWSFNPYAGTHLHLGVRQYVIDSAGWAYTVGPHMRVLHYTNGTMGSVDFKDDLRKATLNDIEAGIATAWLTLRSIQNSLALLINK